jgi:hypothetical protein
LHFIKIADAVAIFKVYRHSYNLCEVKGKVIFEDCKDPNDVLSTTGDHPRLLTMALRKEIAPETLIVLNAILQFLPMWDRRITDTIRWPDYRQSITKYASFLTFDVVKYKLILRKIIL